MLPKTNNIAQVIGGVLLVSQAVVAYLLTQTDVAFDGVPKVILGAASVGLTALGLYLNVRMPGQSGPPA